MQAMLKVLLISCIGGWLFHQMHIPIPWMLGPIVFVMLTQLFYKGSLTWPHYLCDIGIVIVGTVIGIQFNTALFGQMGSLLLYMIIVNVILIGGALGLAYVTAKWTGMPFRAAVLSSIPGGLGQIVVFALEEKIEEIGIISYFQVIRLLLVVILVPFIVAGDIVAKPVTNASMTWLLLGLIMVAWGVSHITKRLHFPVAFFITPILLLLGIQLTTSLAMPAIPSYVMSIAQLLIGAHIGLMLKPHMLKLPARILLSGVLSAIALIMLTIGSSYGMSYVMGTTFVSSFLSAAPGGLDQMVLLADAIHADSSLVSMFQTFRLLFIFMCIMPLLKIAFKRTNVSYEQNIPTKLS